MRLRTILLCLLSATVGACAGVAALYVDAHAIHEELVSREDLTGVAGVSFVSTLLASAVLYAPGLYLLRRQRGGCRPAALFPVVSALPLNAPVALLMLIPLRAGKVSGMGELALIFAAFLAAGLVFGLGFVWNCRRPPARP